MFNVKTFLCQAAAALVLAGSSLAAIAGPIGFQVKLDTSSAALPSSGFVDLQFASLLPATPVTVTFSNFTGAFGAVDYVDGDVVFNPDGSVSLSNVPAVGSLLSFAAGFGGMLGFDVLFSDSLAGDTGTDGATLTIGLLDVDFAPLVDPEGVARFDLQPGVGLVATSNADYVTVIPEPSDWMLMLTGLALLGLTLRRRSAR